MVKSLPTTQGSQVMETGVGECNFHLFSLKLLLRLRGPCTLLPPLSTGPDTQLLPFLGAASTRCSLETCPLYFHCQMGCKLFNPLFLAVPENNGCGFSCSKCFTISHYKSTRCKTLRKLQFPYNHYSSGPWMESRLFSTSHQLFQQNFSFFKCNLSQ